MPDTKIMSLRPSERVIHFLETEFNLNELPEGKRLPTIEELANRLNISEGTIKSTYRDLAKKGIIESVRGKGSFIASKAPLHAVKRYTIGINMDKHASHEGLHSWAYQLYGGILKASLEWEAPVDIQWCGAAQNTPDTETTLEETISKLDGLILFRLTEQQLYERVAAKYQVPFISLNQSSTSDSENFVSPDYFHCSRNLGWIWRQVEKKRILFLSAPHPDQSTSIRERLGGLAAGLADALGTGTELRVRVCEDGRSELAYASIRQLLKKDKWIPDAIYGAGDLMIAGAFQALEEEGIRVPEQVSLIGGNGSLRYVGKTKKLALAVTDHPMEQVGELLLKQILLRVKSGGETLPGKFVPVPLVPGATLSVQENELIHQVSQ